MPPKHVLFESSAKPELGWVGEFILHTTSRPQPPASAAAAPLTTTEDALNASDALTRTFYEWKKLFRGRRSQSRTVTTSSSLDVSTALPPGGFLRGTWAYYPLASVPADSPAPAITAAEESAALALPLRAVCSGCDQQVENMQTVKDVGYVCSECLTYNTRRV